MEELKSLVSVTMNIEKQQVQRQKPFRVLTLIGLPTILDSVCDQILASPTVPTIDELFSSLLRLAMPPSHTMVSSLTIDCSNLASQTTKNPTS